MPSKLTGYQKVINKCEKNGWFTYPSCENGFDYDELHQMIKYGEAKIKIGITHSPKTWEEYKKLIFRYKLFGKGVFLEKLVFIHGKELGIKIFEDYRKKQAYTNTFEYKNKKFGMSIGEFENYNKSRAVTLSNLVKKYGDKIGEIKFNAYKKRQAFTNSKEYLGEVKYNEVNRKKSHNLETYIEKYGEDTGRTKLIEFYGKLTPNRSYSKISQELFTMVENILKDDEKDKTYYATKNKEYCVLDGNRVFLYDFVCTKLQLCIEYHGDHYHGNPLIYKPDEYLKGRGCTKIRAKDKWKTDKFKIELLKRVRNYDTIVIWDCDWRKNSDLLIEKIENHINKIRNNGD